MSHSADQVAPTEASGGDTAVRRRILVVDDSPMQRRMLGASLRKWGFDVTEAESGEAALAILRETPVPIVLSDWMMPGMDGPELCREFRKIARDGYGYFILLTSKSGKEDVARGLGVGADDFLSKPVAFNELRARIAAGERILRMTEELTEKNDLLSSALKQLKVVYDGIDRDLLEARKLQQSLVPERYRDFGTGQMALLMRPSGHVGGDLVGQFRINEQRVALYSIDVSGHGVASALMTARLASYLSGASPAQNIAIAPNEFGIFEMRPPHEVCAALNELLLREMETDLYFTMCLAEVDLRSGRVKLTQAGHPNPAIQRASGGIDFIEGGGLPIGLIPGATWETQEFRLGPCDRLLIYSDGLTECSSPEGELLEEEGLARMMQASRRLTGYRFLEALVWDLERFAGTSEFNDDLSGVFFQYDGIG